MLGTTKSSHNDSSVLPPRSANFDNLYPALIECFGIIVLGYITGRLGGICRTGGKGLGKFAVNAALPAFIFKAIATIDFSQLTWKFVLVVTLAKVLLFLSVVIVTLLFTRDIGKAGIYGTFCTVSNDLAMGIPVLKAMYEDSHKEFVDCLYFLALVSLVIILPVGLLMMEFRKQQSEHTSSTLCHMLLKTLKAVLKNPAVLSSIFSIPFNFISHQDIPAALDRFLGTLSQAFPAAALFYLGLSVVGKIRAQTGMVILVPLSLVAAKVLILPLMIRAFLNSFKVGGSKMNEDWSSFGFIYGTLPPAPSSVVFAGVFGMQEDMLSSALVIATAFSAPVIFSSSKMVSVYGMNSTQIAYKSLLSTTRNDISYVAIVLACWVILILFLSRRYKVPPHSYTICLAVTQLCLCVSFVLTESHTLMTKSIRFIYLLFTTFLFGTHCWVAVLAFSLARIRCCADENRNMSRKLLMYFFGWGLPICCGGLTLIAIDSDLDGFNFEKDFIHFLQEKHVFSGVWVTVQFICVLVCISSLIYIYRCDTYCKCSMHTRRNGIDEKSPLIPGKDREECHRCKKSNSCTSSVERRRLDVSTDCGVTDIEDIDVTFLLQKSKGDDERMAEAGSKGSLKLEKYYEGEKHQVARHIIVIVCHILLMIVCIFYCMWTLVGDKRKSGIFLEVQLLVSIVLPGQVLIEFAVFGFERALIIYPFLQKLRRHWYGIDEIILPRLSDLPSDEYHICEQFVRHHKDHCMRKLTCESSSPDIVSGVNGDDRSFLGNELVDWLLEVGLVSDRITAKHYGNSLLRGRVIRHAENRHHFEDRELCYEFCKNWEGNQKKLVDQDASLIEER